MILATLSLVGFNAYGAFQVEQKFDPVLYLRNDSYPRQFQEALKLYFPKLGQRGGVYIGAIDYFEQQEALLRLGDSLRQNPYINMDNFGFWLLDFVHWMKQNKMKPEDYAEFRSYLAEFLFTTDQGYPHIKVYITKFQKNDESNSILQLLKQDYMLLNSATIDLC